MASHVYHSHLEAARFIGWEFALTLKQDEGQLSLGEEAACFVAEE